MADRRIVVNIRGGADPRSVPMSEARRRAVAKLTADGWAWLPERSEFIHATQGRGRLVYVPDYDADPNDKMVREVRLQPPNDRPTTADDIINHTPTVPEATPILTFWEVTS